MFIIQLLEHDFIKAKQQLSIEFIILLKNYVNKYFVRPFWAFPPIKNDVHCFFLFLQNSKHKGVLFFYFFFS